MSEWISVKDRLPKWEEKVLVYCKPDDGDNFQSWSGCQTAILPEGFTQFLESLTNCGCTSLDGPVTHWMPLPEPPKETL